MKRETINKLFRTAVLTAALAVLTGASTSCTKDTEQEPGAGAADGVIRITSQIAASRQSRGVSLGDKVLTEVVLLRTDATTATAPASFVSPTRITASRQTDGTLASFSSAPYYKTNNDYAHFVAMHPRANAYSATYERWTQLNGTKDLLLTEQSWCAGRYSAPVTTGMVFEHQLAQLQVICKPDPDAALSLVNAAWGQITKIDLLETATTATFDYATRTMSFSDPATLTLRKSDCETAFTNVTLAENTTTPCAGGMYAPAASGTLPLKLKIYTAASTDGVPVEVQLKSGTTNMGFAKGMTHTVTLTFGVTNKEIGVSASSVDAWTEGGTGESGTISSPAQVGDYYYSDDTWSSELRYDKKVVGVIFWANPAVPGHMKVVSLSGPPAAWGGVGNEDEKLPWSTTSIDVGTSYPAIRATSSDALDAPARQSGAANRAVLQQYLDNNTMGHTIANFPAFGWCDAMNTDGQTGWVLPSINEMQELYCGSRGAPASYWTTTAPSLGSSSILDAKLVAAGGTNVEKNGNPHIVSTESSATAIWSMYTHNGSTFPTDVKVTSRYVRCVREVWPPTVEDYYYSDGTYSRDLQSGKTVEGVIYWVDATNPKHFKIASMDEPPANWDGGTNSAGQLPWSTEKVTTGVTSKSNGKSNTLTLMKLPNANLYKAAKWCYTKNAGLSVPAAASAATTDAAYKWYLPATDELQHLLCASWGVAPSTWRDTPSFSAAAGYPEAWNARFTTTPFAAAGYWSGTENSSGGGWYVGFSTGSTYTSTKTSTDFRTRCVREITLP